MTKLNVTPLGVYAFMATSYILYNTWRNTPEWLRRKSKSDKDANDDLASPTAILAKLQELGGIIQEKTGEITLDLPWYKLHACFISLFHLSAEIRAKHPEHRDGLFQECGAPVDKEEAQYLAEMLDYAHWAYLMSNTELLTNLKSRGYQVLRHDTATEPGRVGHYIAMNYQEGICLIGLKGTSTFSDVLTDVIGTIMPHSLDKPFSGNETDIICHEGIFVAATMVADDLQGFLENLVIPKNYRVVITGHSLGAGTACLLGLLLSSRIPSLQKDGKLQVVAFATPAVLNYTACKACMPFTTSVVNNTDMVPRMSISNLLTMNRGLVEVNRRLEEKGLSPDSLKKAYRYAQDLCKLDEDTLMTVDELDALFVEIHENDSLTDEHDLYVPGRVVALYERGAVQEEATVGGVVADGSMKMLRQLELTTSMIQDHFCTSYKASLDALLRDLSSSSQ